MRRKRGLYLTRRAKECDLEEETKTVEQKVLLCEEKMSSVMSSKKSNLDVPVEDVDGCTDRRFARGCGRLYRQKICHPLWDTKHRLFWFLWFWGNWRTTRIEESRCAMGVLEVAEQWEFWIR